MCVCVCMYACGEREMVHLHVSPPLSLPPPLLQVVEDGYEFFAKRQLVTLFSAPNYCGEFDNAGAMMSVDETLMCSFQVSFTNKDLTSSISILTASPRDITLYLLKNLLA